VFERGFGIDTIKDFLAVGPNSDKIDLSAFKSVSFASLHIVQLGKNVEISGSGLGVGNKIILEVVNAGAVTRDDFILSRSGAAKVNVVADARHAINGTDGNHTLVGTDAQDALNGGRGNDRMLGGADADTLNGGPGRDRMSGGSGGDQIAGGAGADVLTGGSGKDAFIFAFANEGVDTITDFVSNSDWLQISAAGFGGGLFANAAAHLVSLADIAGYTDGGSRGLFLFDNSGAAHGTLYWDSNGGSGSDAIAIARINGASLLQADLHIV
jgi:Ca2+-binding RTX toxin-like protein